jgi:hypothetical protein
MTPKEKAQELVSKFKELPQEGTLMFYLAFEISKQCALIAVDEILSTLYDYHYDSESGAYEFWQEVKTEIEKL